MVLDMLLETCVVLFVLCATERGLAAQTGTTRQLGYQPSSPCCWPKPRNCADLYKSGVHTNGVYHVYPLREDQPAAVSCDMTSDGGGWTVFQKRFTGEVDFYRGWDDYKNGFGSVFREYWWGNDKLNHVTSQEPQQLRVDMSDFKGQTRYAKYSYFGVADAAGNYRVNVGGYSGNAGDSFSIANTMRFSTKDVDHDTCTTNADCAKLFKGGWWYGCCHHSNLNGLYKKGVTTTYADSMCWRAWHGYYYSLKRSEMKIRPVNF